ncbi:MAG: LptA/OstA family protein [Pseudomonadota bacterium]
MALGLAAALAALVCAPAAAQLSASDEPVDVTADQLEVRRDDRLAIFSGNVIALQGEARLTAAQLTIFFAADADAPSQAAAPPEAAADGAAADGWGDISAMQAVGGVRYQTAEETAVGERAVYDADARTITLYENVTVTRGEDVVRGARLVVDVDSGKSVMEGGASGRVRGLFHIRGRDGADASDS